MIFTWTGHISKRLAGSPKGSEVESHSSLTSYSHCLVCVCNVRLCAHRFPQLACLVISHGEGGPQKMLEEADKEVL